MSLKLPEATMGKAWEVGELGKGHAKNKSNSEGSKEKNVSVI